MQNVEPSEILFISLQYSRLDRLFAQTELMFFLFLHEAYGKYLKISYTKVADKIAYANSAEEAV